MFTVHSGGRGFVLTRHMNKSGVLWPVVVLTGPQLMKQDCPTTGVCRSQKHCSHFLTVKGPSHEMMMSPFCRFIVKMCIYSLLKEDENFVCSKLMVSRSGSMIFHPTGATDDLRL